MADFRQATDRLRDRISGRQSNALDDIMKAYNTCQHAATEGALKVVLKNEIVD